MVATEKTVIRLLVKRKFHSHISTCVHVDAMEMKFP